MKQINWKESYPNLPTIPLPKRWLENGIAGTATEEQIISHKLHFKEPISGNEEKELLECIRFYNELADSLKRFDFTSVKDDKLEEFINYFDYAYNYLWLHSNQIELFETYRLVNNSDRKSKEFVHQLGHPSLDIAKKKNALNRASSSKSTVFYSSETVDLAFKELKPSIGKIVTLGVWIPKGNRKLLAYPIMGNPSVQLKNENSRTAGYAFSELKNRFHPLFGLFMDGYFNILNYEFSKPIKNKQEYLISSLFSERIFEEREKNWTYDCIVYPSVGGEYTLSNFAIKPSVVDSRLQLIKAFEFEIGETFYDKKASTNKPRELSVANVKIRRESKSIIGGRIEWI